MRTYEVVEGEFVGVPKEIKDSFLKERSLLIVKTSLGSGVGEARGCRIGRIDGGVGLVEAAELYSVQKGSVSRG